MAGASPKMEPPPPPPKGPAAPPKKAGAKAAPDPVPKGPPQPLQPEGQQAQQEAGQQPHMQAAEGNVAADGNIGGGGFAVIHTSNAQAATLDYREVAPLSASKDMFGRDENNNNISSLTSKSASGVPGSVMGMWNLYLRYGSRNLSWSDLLTPAITLADTGFFITEKLSEELNYNSLPT